ncbi:hypothetical protein MASR2M70_20510 [Bacillota bacterium]
MVCIFRFSGQLQSKLKILRWAQNDTWGRLRMARGEMVKGFSCVLPWQKGIMRIEGEGENIYAREEERSIYRYGQLPGLLPLCTGLSG